MRLLGNLQGEQVLVLIDGRDSHNFITNGLVSKLSLSVQKTKFYDITMGDGYTMKGNGVCKGVTLNLQGTTIVQACYSYELSGADLVLGTE